MNSKTRYPQGVVAFAVAERIKGEKWADIRRGITDHFNLEPPTERRMRDWFNNYGNIGVPTIQQEIKCVIKHEIRATADKKMIAQDNTLNELLLHNIVAHELRAVKYAVERGEDPMMALGIDIMSRVANIVGIDKFNKMVATFLSINGFEISLKQAKSEA